MQKILIVTPTHTKLNEDTLRCVFELTLPENTIVDYYLPWHGYPQTDEFGRENLALKQNESRRVALAGNYSHLFFVEEDMLIPKDALLNLLKANADVAYGLYCFRRYPHTWNAVAALNTESLTWYAYNFGEPSYIRSLWGSVVPVDGLGFGCTLISRKVLKEIEFRIDWDKPHMDGNISHSDVYFALDCLEAGFTQVCDTSVVCGHITQTPNPSVIIPVIPGSGLEKTAYRFIPYDGFQSENPILQKYEEWIYTPSDIQGHLAFLKENAKGTVVELGTRYGASTSAFVAACIDGSVDKVLSFDVDPMCAELLNIPGYKDYLEVYIQDSCQAIEVPVDTLFIDTIHTKEQVTKELDAWVPFLNDNAIILFHDTEIEGVYKAITTHPLLKNSKKYFFENSHGLGVVYYVKFN